MHTFAADLEKQLLKLCYLYDCNYYCYSMYHYAGWIEEDIHWAWATFAGIPCAYIGLLCITAYIKLLFLIPIALMGGGGYLGYLGWIEEEIHWAWAAFAGIPCILGGLALWAIMSQEDAFK